MPTTITSASSSRPIEPGSCRAQAAHTGPATPAAGAGSLASWTAGEAGRARKRTRAPPPRPAGSSPPRTPGSRAATPPRAWRRLHSERHEASVTSSMPTVIEEQQPAAPVAQGTCALRLGARQALVRVLGRQQEAGLALRAACRPGCVPRGRARSRQPVHDARKDALQACSARRPPFLLVSRPPPPQRGFPTSSSFLPLDCGASIPTCMRPELCRSNS